MFRRPQRALAVLIAFAFVAVLLPTAEAQDPEILPCNGRNLANYRTAGIIIDFAGQERGVCLGYYLMPLDDLVADIQTISVAADPQVEECDPEFEGGAHFEIFTFTGSACLEAGKRIRWLDLQRCSTMTFQPERCIYYSLTDCGPHAIDPAVALFGVSVWFCIFYHLDDPGEGSGFPVVEVDPFFCPERIDPTVFLNGERVVSICADVLLGNEGVRQAIVSILDELTS